MSYREDVADRTLEHIRALETKLKALDERRAAVKKEIAEARAVLKVISSGVNVPMTQKAALSSGDVISFEYAGQKRSLPRGAVNYFAQQTRFRRIDVTEYLKVQHPEKAATTADWVIGYLISTNKVRRVKMGCYESTSSSQKPLPRERPYVEDGAKVHIVNGSMTTEELPTRGYGR